MSIVAALLSFAVVAALLRDWWGAWSKGMFTNLLNSKVGAFGAGSPSPSCASGSTA